MPAGGSRAGRRLEATPAWEKERIPPAGTEAEAPQPQETTPGSRPARRSGAPRLIEWTGERCVPWGPDVQVAYEHYHRYMWAAELARDRRVLDLGCGEGFGSAILASTAASVHGIDIDERTVEHARLNYAGQNLTFSATSAVDLSELGGPPFDMVVAFEVIEHIAEQEHVLDQVLNVLTADGLLVISTPDRLMYTDAASQENPYHERELTEEEFRALLGRHFPHVSLWGQRAATGSRISALDGASDRTQAFTLERAGDEWREGGRPAPLYLVAVASRQRLEPPPAESALHDHGLELVQAREGELGEAIEAEREATETARRAADEAREGTARAEADAVAARDELDRTRAELEQANRHVLHFKREEQDLRAQLDEVRAERAGDIDREIVSLVQQLAGAYTRLDEAEAAIPAEKAAGADVRRRLARVEGSVVWQAMQRVRASVYGAKAEHSWRGRALSALLRGMGRSVLPPPAEPVAAGSAPVSPIRLPRFEHPLASILVAMHSSGEVGERALRTLARNSARIPFELVVVNDRADDETTRVIEALENAHVIANEENLGFLRSVNRAAAAARGRYLILLNDDTEVQPGWLEALVDCADSDPNIAYVAPKLIYPDGRLQEAGGIVWSDGTGWNYGRGDDPALPRYNYRRDVDYGSAAAVLVRTEAWNEVGGFDERYLPNYFEDSDLCLALRERGHRIVYEPHAVVVHHEGVSHGTGETDARGKRHQALNRPKFAAKWRKTLTEHLPVPPVSEPRAAADRNRGPRVLVVEHRVPTPDRASGSMRNMQVIGSLLELGCRVTLLPDNLWREEPYTTRLEDLGVEVLLGHVDVHAELAEIGPEVRMAIVARPHVAPRWLDLIRHHAPSALIAYETHDLHFLRERRRAELEGRPLARANAIREIELALVRACDVTIVVSEKEKEHLLKEAPEADVAILPNANQVQARVPPAAGRTGLAFVGGFTHPPNVDAAIYLARSIMPLVRRELGNVELKIVGPDVPDEIRELESPGIVVTGWVEDLTSLLNETRVMVAPLRYGAGMKGKVTQSLALGLPVVTTTDGAEGLDAEHGQDILIADDPESFAAAVAQLYRDDELWARLSKAGQRVAGEQASPQLMCDRVAGLLELAGIPT